MVCAAVDSSWLSVLPLRGWCIPAPSGLLLGRWLWLIHVPPLGRLSLHVLSLARSRADVAPPVHEALPAALPRAAPAQPVCAPHQVGGGGGQAEEGWVACSPGGSSLRNCWKSPPPPRPSSPPTTQTLHPPPIPPTPLAVLLRSVEYISDIAAELRRMLLSGALPPAERLRMLLTAAEMIHRQVGGRFVGGGGSCVRGV